MQRPTEKSLPATLGWRLRLCRLHWWLHVSISPTAIDWDLYFQILRVNLAGKNEIIQVFTASLHWASCHLSFVLHVFSGGFQRDRMINVNLCGRRGFLVHNSGCCRYSPWLKNGCFRLPLLISNSKEQGTMLLISNGGTSNNVADQQQLLVSNVLNIHCLLIGNIRCCGCWLATPCCF